MSSINFYNTFDIITNDPLEAKRLQGRADLISAARDILEEGNGKELKMLVEAFLSDDSIKAVNTVRSSGGDVSNDAITLLAEVDKGELTTEQAIEILKRFAIARKTSASEALEGYKPLKEECLFAYELQQRWIKGEITIQERIRFMKQFLGYEEET